MLWNGILRMLLLSYLQLYLASALNVFHVIMFHL